jgi:protein O-GlcNAcase / histone acetyltransferase
MLSGVIEGFYGQPWTQSERLELFDWMAAWDLNTYVYAPKDDLHHRALWREPYVATEAGRLRELIEAGAARNLRFVYGLSPGSDIHYGREAELNHLWERFEQMIALGCSDFSVLFDDIHGEINGSDLARWGSLGSAQCHVANALFTRLRARNPAARFLFCPTAYCGRMAAAKLGGENYLPTLGRELLPEIDIFWTGPDIVSREITVAHVREIAALLRRKPLVWDNLHANDYDGRRFFCGPYSGRPPELRGEVSGLLSNPNTEFPLNYVPLRTLAAYVQASDSWAPRSAYLAAMREWAPSFATVRGPALSPVEGPALSPVEGSVPLEDLVLFGDCYYLPHEEGPEAEGLYRAASSMLDDSDDQSAASIFRARASRLRAFCAAMTELRHRPLFHALSRRTWELREQLDLLDRVASVEAGEGGHLPVIRHAGLVARLQHLLALRMSTR